MASRKLRGEQLKFIHENFIRSIMVSNKNKSLFLKLLDYMCEVFDQNHKSFYDSSIDPKDRIKLVLNDQKNLLLLQTHLLKVWIDFFVQGTKDENINNKMKFVYQTWRKEVKNIIDDGVKKGVFNKKYAKQVPFILVGLMEGAMTQYINDPDTFDIEDYFNTSYDIIINLLVTSEN